MSKMGIRWSLILGVTGVLTLLIAYSQTHLTELVSSVQTLPELPVTLWKYLSAIPAGLLRGLPDIVSVAALVAVSSGVGFAALDALGRRAKLDFGTLYAAERVGIGASVGLGIMSIGALLLGLLGLFRVEALWLLVIAAGILARWSIIAWLRCFSDLWHPRLWTRWDWALAALAGFVLTAALLFALSPPTAWDALTYHLVAPTRYLAAGRIDVQPDNTYLGFSQSVETLYGITISVFGRDTSAAVLHWCFGVLGLLTLGGLLTRTVSRAGARLGLALLLSAFSVWDLFGIPYVDLALLALSAAMISALLTWQETKQDGWLVLIGMCGGLTLGVKYSGGLFLVAAVLAAIAIEPRRLFKIALLTGLPAALLFAPWMLRGFLLWGNPVYPFVFGGVNWDGLRSSALSTVGFGMIFRGDAWQLPVLPISATIFGMDGVAEYDFSTGPLLLVAPIFLLMRWNQLGDRARQTAKVSMMLIVTMTAFWIVMAAGTRIGAQTRLVIMALPVFAIAGAIAIDALAAVRPRELYRVLNSVILLGLAAVTLQITSVVSNTRVLDYHMSGDRETYLDWRLKAHMTAMHQLDTLPDDARVVLLFDPRGYYCPQHVTCHADLLFDIWGRPLKQGRQPDEVMAELRLGSDYVLVFDQGLEFWTSIPNNFNVENALLPDALNRWMTAIWSGGSSYTLYEWRTQPE